MKHLFTLIIIILFFKSNAQDINSRWQKNINEGKKNYAIENYKKALEFFKAASQIIPTDTTAFVYIMDCGYKAVNSEIVYKSFENLQFLNYETHGIYEILIATARDVDKDYQKSLNYVEIAKKKYVNNKNILFEEINTYYKYRDYETTKDEINTFLKLFPNYYKAHKLLIYIEKEIEKNFENSLSSVIQAEIIFPDSLELQKQEADIYLRTGDFGKAQLTIEKSISQNPTDPTLYYNLALLFNEKQDYEQSVEICKKAIELDTNYLDAIYNVGTFYLQYGLTYNVALSDMSLAQYKSQGAEFERNAIEYLKKAKPYFEKAIKLNPDELDAFENLNTINVLLGNLKNTVAYLNNNKQVLKNIANPKLLINNLNFQYANEKTKQLEKGETGHINFELENIGSCDARNLEIIIMEPLAIPCLEYNKIVKIDSVSVGNNIKISIPVTHLENTVNKEGIKTIEDAKNKLRLLVKNSNGQSADMVEFTLNLSNNRFAGLKNNLYSDTEDIDYFHPKPIPKNFLLIMAVDDYEYWTRLNNPVKDALAVKNILLSNYNFDDDNLFEIYNSDVTQNNIRNELIKIKNEIKPSDNLIIYYAGHGYYDKEFDDGSWIPVDAQVDFETDYLSNLRLVKYLKKITARHIFLIADACFSGSLFENTKNISFQPNNDTIPSRWGLSSGNMEFVADGAKDCHSPFAENFINCLNENTRKDLPVSELISYIKFKVKNVTSQTPVGRPLKMEANKGGEFIFYKK
ncbi:MAG: caspase family protein [Bacteroidales bacterium]|nr:caspase family protein [Bacteroidales bacterium]